MIIVGAGMTPNSEADETFDHPICMELRQSSTGKKRQRRDPNINYVMELTEEISNEVCTQVFKVSKSTAWQMSEWWPSLVCSQRFVETRTNS
jgi:hypothetical protein